MKKYFECDLTKGEFVFELNKKREEGSEAIVEYVNAHCRLKENFPIEFMGTFANQCVKVFSKKIELTLIARDFESRGNALLTDCEDGFVEIKNTVALTKPKYNSYKAAVLLENIFSLCEFRESDDLMITSRLVREIGKSDFEQGMKWYEITSAKTLTRKAMDMLAKRVGSFADEEEWKCAYRAPLDYVGPVENVLYRPLEAEYNIFNGVFGVNVEVAVLFGGQN